MKPLDPLIGPLLLTIAVEALVYFWLLPGRRWILLSTAGAINLITVPIANAVFAPAIGTLGSFLVAFVAIEAAVIAAEAPLVRAVAGAVWPESVRTSIVANGCSMALSPLFWDGGVFRA